MDFFASQEAARRSSRSLVVLFIAALIGIAILVNLLVYLVLQTPVVGHYSETTMLQITGGVILLVLAGSVYRIYSLKRGGEVIAAALGGRLVSDGGSGIQEQRLISVVEEMAIASGLPVPPVYIIEEDGINAFAAGYSSNDAVIGVTRGALTELNRDQLQGVVAHEFSHIINGDMALNIRLVGLLHGILMLSYAGKMMLQGRSGVARRTSAAFPVLFLGLGLFAVGAIGKFFGDLIKAGVSRQREFLADASAVQFTRNNAGIAGALKRIGGYVAGSNVHHAGAEEFSHLYFSNSAKLSFMNMLATHPPLAERIERLEPGWDGAYLLDASAPSPEPQIAGVQGFAASSAQSAPADYSSTAVTESVGVIQDVSVATQILSGIPAEIRTAVRETYSVRAVLYGLFLRSDRQRREQQEAVLKDHADLFVRARLRELEPVLGDIGLEQRLPILELALPAVRQLSESEYTRMMDNIKRLLKTAAPVTLSEWALSYYLQHHTSGTANLGSGKKNLSSVQREIEYLLSVLAYSDGHRHQSVEEAFRAGLDMLDLELTLQPKQELSIAKLQRAAENLNHLKPLQKPKVLKAFVAVIHSDDVLSPVEVELVRCFADAIDCPLPPLKAA